METTITSQIDQAIDAYQAEHGGSKPLYCIMSAEEADEITHLLRERRGEKDDVVITSYRDIKIIRDSLRERGKYFLCNELPEMGS